MALRRNLHADTLLALQGNPFYPVLMVYLDWPVAAVRAHTNVGTLVWDTHNWAGIGMFGRVQLPAEDAGMAMQPAEMRLVGAPDEIDAYLTAPIRNRAARVYFGVVTERAGNVLIGEPIRVFTGYMDAMRDVTQASDGTLRRDIVLTAASGPSQRSFAEMYHTYEDQLGTYPGAATGPATYTGSSPYPGDTAGRFAINAEAERDTMTWPA